MEIIDPHFESAMIGDQDILGTESRIKKFLGMVADEQLKKALEDDMLRQDSSDERWAVFQERATKDKKKVLYFTFPFLKGGIRIYYLERFISFIVKETVGNVLN